MATTRKSSTTKASTTKAISAKPTPASAPLDLVAQSHRNHAEALAVLERRQKEQADWRSALTLLNERLSSGDESVISAALRDAEGELKRMGVLVDAAQAQVTKTDRARINTSTVLADALAPYLGKIVGLVPATTWETHDLSTQPVSVPSAVLVQREKETASGDGFLSGSVTFYFTRTRLHALPNASALTEGLEALDVQARVSDGWATMHEDESTTHFFHVKVEKLAPAVPVVSVTGAVSEGARQRIGYAIGETIEPAFRLHESAYMALRPTIGSSGVTEASLLQNVLVRTGTPSLYSDTTGEDGIRTVSVLVDAHCHIQHASTRQVTATRLQTGLSGIVEKAVGKMVAGAGRFSATQVQTAKIADDQGSVSAQLLVSYVSTLPTGQQAPAVEALGRKPSPADSEWLEDGDEDLAGYVASLATSRDVDMHGDRQGSHPGQEG